MDVMTNILLQRYRQQASLLSGLRQTMTLQKTGLSGSSALLQNQLPGSIQTLAPGQQTQTGAPGTSAFYSGGALTSLSATGSYLNQFAAAIGSNADAQTGLRAFTLELGNNRYNTDGISSMRSLRDLQETDTGLFTSAFATAGQLANAGGNAGSFLKSLSSLTDNASQSSMVRSISDIMRSEGTNAERTQLTGSIMSTISDIQRNTTGDEQRTALDTFFSELATTKTNEERSAFITIFERKNPNIFLE